MLDIEWIGFEKVQNSQDKLNWMWRYEPMANVVQPRPLSWEEYLNASSQLTDPTEVSSLIFLVFVKF